MTRRPIPTTQKTKAVPQQPRLGVVLRFNREAAASGVRSLASSGFKVASSTDFRSAPAVPNDFGGADVQYFERFGIAIVRRDGDRLQSLLAATTEKSAVSSVRPERYYRVLGSGTPNSQIPIVKPQGPAHLDREYLIGYKDGVNHLVDRLLDGGDEKRLSIARFDETSVTWGLEAVSLPSELSGAGIKVAVLDTGFDHSHPDFFGRAITKKLFATNSSEDDVHGHGTHCIGTACGPLRPTHGVRYGIAYEAEIFAGFHRRTRQDDARDLPRLEGFDRLGDGEIGLAGAGRAERDDDVLLVDGFEQQALIVAAGTDVADVGLVAMVAFFAIEGTPGGLFGEQRPYLRLGPVVIAPRFFTRCPLRHRVVLS